MPLIPKYEGVFILSTEKVMAYPLWSVNLMIELVEGV